MSPTDVAAQLGEVLERRVRYRDVSTRMFVKAARAQRFPTFEIAQVRHYAGELRAGAFADVTDHFEEIVGRPPEDFATTARRYLAEPWRIGTGVRAGSLPGAAWLGGRMLLTRAIDLDRWERSRDHPQIAGGRLAHENPDWLAAAGRRELLLEPEPGERTVSRGA